MKFFAQAISIVFHPVFVPVLVFSFLMAFAPELSYGLEQKQRVLWVITVAYTTILFPLLTTFLLWRLGFIESMFMHHIKERYVPLIACMLFYFWVFWLFHKQFQAHAIIQTFLLCLFLNTMFTFLMTIFNKVSMHAAAWGGVCSFGVLLVFNSVHGSVWFLVASILIGGLVLSSRLLLEAHVKREVYAGLASGILSLALSFLLIHLLN